MYKRDQSLISKYARQSPDNMARTMHFVILTIQQQLTVAVNETLDLSEHNVSLWGFKRKAYYEILERKHELYEELEALHSIGDVDNMLALLTTVHGLGLVKAGFVLQLIYGVSACLDSHNLERLGINPNKVKLGNVKYSTRLRRAKEYHALCERIAPKGINYTEWYWNTWCKFVATTQPSTYDDANHVSKLHVLACTGSTI